MVHSLIRIKKLSFIVLFRHPQSISKRYAVSTTIVAKIRENVENLIFSDNVTSFPEETALVVP